MQHNYVIGVDFGSDSVRALLVDATTGKELGNSVNNYRRWAAGMYSDASQAQFRHHPLDYSEGLEEVLKNVVALCPDPQNIRAIAVDTTASTPVLVDARCTPLALLPGNEENPDAMFVLWKDHTAQHEADRINEVLKTMPVNYATHSGNHYSAECFWAKMLHNLRHSPQLQSQAVGAMELCDWITAILTGSDDIRNISLGHCAAGAKMMNSPRWGGYPPREFFDAVDPLLYPLVENLTVKTTGAHLPAGNLTAEWAAKLGLTTDVVIGAGNVDSYSGAVGGGVQEGTIVLNLGTSQCQMAVRPMLGVTGETIKGIFGEYDGSILPGLEGLEAGISAFGDLYAWFKRILAWPMRRMAENSDNPEVKAAVAAAEDSMLADLSEEALKLNVTEDSPLATDYINGRRTPFPQNDLSAALVGMRISTTAPELYYAFAEASAFATKAIVELFLNNDVKVDRMIAIGGIAIKSPLVMQLIADVTQRPIEVSDCKHSCALGSAINGAVAAGLYDTVGEAQAVICPPTIRTYQPNPDKAELMAKRYARYLAVADFTEKLLLNNR